MTRDVTGTPSFYLFSPWSDDKLAIFLRYIITTFLVDVIKYLTGSHLQGEGFTLGLQFKGMQSIMVKMWQQEGKAQEQEQETSWS